MRPVFPFADKYHLFYFEKGGGGYTPPPVDHTLEVQQMKQEHDDKVAAQAKADAEAAHAAAGARGNQLLSSGYEGGLGKARGTLGAKGLDPNSGYGQQIMQLLTQDYDTARAGADPFTTTNAGTVFLPSMFDNDYQTVRGGAKAKLDNQYNQFASSGFDRGMVKDTDDDAILQSILGDQFTDANDTIQRAFARGQINDSGLAYANKELGKQKLSGMSKAQDTGMGVLSGYRTQLNDFLKPTRTRIDNFDLTDNIDLDGVQHGLGDLNTSLHGRMEGDILNALGGQNFFDTDTLLASAGSRSGALNNPTSSGFGGLSGGTLGGASNPSGVGGGGLNDLLSAPLDTTKAKTNSTDTTKTNSGF